MSQCHDFHQLINPNGGRHDWDELYLEQQREIAVHQEPRYVPKHIISSRGLLPRLPAAPPCLVLGPHSYNVKCIYPYTRRVCIGSRQPTGEVAPSRLHRLATAEVDRLAENTNSD